MTEIEEAMELIRPGCICEVNMGNTRLLAAALEKAIEQHEAFKQEVSDALEKRCFYIDDRDLGRFIIAKPDPLVDAVQDWWDADGYNDVANLRAAIEKRGGKIVWGEE